MSTPLKTGEEIVREFFEDLDKILDDNKELADELRRLQSEGKFSDTKLTQSLETLRKGAIKK